MNSYSRDIGDYLKDAAHLSLLKHGIYGRLLDVYYARELPIPEVRAAELVGARSKSERIALGEVLQEFFVLSGGSWYQSRCEEEIAVTQCAFNTGAGGLAQPTKASERQRRWRERRAAMFDALHSRGIVLPPDTPTRDLVNALERTGERGGQDPVQSGTPGVIERCVCGCPVKDVAEDETRNVPRDVKGGITRDARYVTRDVTGDVTRDATRDGKPLVGKQNLNPSGSNDDGDSSGTHAREAVGVTESVTESVTEDVTRDAGPGSVSRDVPSEDCVNRALAPEPAQRHDGADVQQREALCTRFFDVGNGNPIAEDAVTASASRSANLAVIENPAVTLHASGALLTATEVSMALIRWERERNKVARVSPVQQQVIDLAALGVTRDELHRAYEAAIVERVASHDPTPVNAGFVRAFIEKGRRAQALPRASPRASPGWSGQGKFDPVAYLSRRAASSAGVIDVSSTVVSR